VVHCATSTAHVPLPYLDLTCSCNCRLPACAVVSVSPTCAAAASPRVCRHRLDRACSCCHHAHRARCFRVVQLAPPPNVEPCISTENTERERKKMNEWSCARLAGEEITIRKKERNRKNELSILKIMIHNLY
jgi:hypothetical protein